MIEGRLRDIPLSDVFQTIVTGQKSGILTVVDGLNRARAYFDRGRLQTAHVSPGPHLGEILVRMDVLTAREVQELLMDQARENAGTPLGVQAVARGWVDEDDLRAAIEWQATETVGAVIAWADGEFAFAERSPFASQVPTDHALDAMALLMRVATDFGDEGEQVGPDSVLRRAGDPTKVAMPAGAWEVLGHVDGKRTSRSVAAELDVPARRVYRILHELLDLGVLEEQPFDVHEPLVLTVSPSDGMRGLVALALEWARRRRPNAIVIDGAVPDVWDLVRDLRGVSGFKHLPIVVLADGDDDGWFARLRRPQAEVLVKPFQEIDFQQLVTGLLGRSLVSVIEIESSSSGASVGPGVGARSAPERPRRGVGDRGAPGGPNPCRSGPEPGGGSVEPSSAAETTGACPSATRIAPCNGPPVLLPSNHSTDA